MTADLCLALLSLLLLVIVVGVVAAGMEWRE